MAPPIEDMLQDLDEKEVLQDVLAAGKLIGLATDAWEPGDIAFDLTDAFVSVMVKAWNLQIAPGIRAQFLDHASGAWLTLKGWADFNRPRTEDTFAEGAVTLENRGIFVGTVAVGQVKIKGPGNATYSNTESGYLSLYSGAGGYPVVTLTFKADTAGAGANVVSNGLATYPTPLASGPASVYVQSNAAMIGADEESDPLLKRRCRLAVTERGNGPRGALESIALDPIGAWRRAGLPVPSTWPATVAITRARVVEPGNAAVIVYLASASGAASGTTSTVDSDVYIANMAVQTLATVPGGTATVAPATEKAINHGTITLWVRRESNVSKAEAEATATAALAKFYKEIPIGGERLSPGSGGSVLIDHVRAVAMAGPGVFHCAFSGVGADVSLAVSEVPVPSYTVVAQIVTQEV